MARSASLNARVAANNIATSATAAMKENAALHAKILTTSQRERATLKGENERLDFEWMARVISSHNLEKRKLPAKQRLTFPRALWEFRQK